MSFPMVALMEVIKHRNQFIQIDDLENYKRCRVQLHAQGVVLRDIVSGAEIKTKKQQVCRTGDFLVAEIDAKIGGFGIVPPELDGAIVSSHYFLFVTDENRLDRRFLDFFIRTPYFREQVTAKGTTNYAAIRPADVLSYKIPLPPLSEQRRIVARIEELAAKIEKARGLRRKAGEEAKALLSSALHRQFDLPKKADIPKQPIATLATILRGRGPIYQEGSGKLAINQKCVRWNGIDIVHAKEVSEGWIQSLPSNFFLQDNDILVNSTGEGTIGRACVLTQNAIGFPFDSHVLVIRVEIDKVLPIFITYYLRSPFGQEVIEDSKGAKTTKQTELGTTKLGKIIIPLPSLPEQRRIVAYLDVLQEKVDALRRLQAETGADLDALLPAVLDRAFKGEL
jgi:type I restriction enzyme S subunit